LISTEGNEEESAPNTADAQTTVRVTNPPPTITCPADILTITDRGQCTATVNFTPITSAGGTVICNPPSGSAFPVGTTIVGNWEITGDLTVKLPATRLAKGRGRVYTITMECTDDSGNAATKSVTVAVPLSQKAKSATSGKAGGMKE